MSEKPPTVSDQNSHGKAMHGLEDIGVLMLGDAASSDCPRSTFST